ncbi:MAG: RNA methyltransferase [Bacteroidales bacterium]
MLSKNKIKFINSIKKKKYRDIHQVFFAEGEKIIDELLKSEAEILNIFATADWAVQQLNLSDDISQKIEIITLDELKKISALSSPNKVLATIKIPKTAYDKNEISNKLSILLDDVNDPGNLGTIIRIADWFGIENIFCTKSSVELYNPKVVQATMGAIFRVNVHYVDFHELLTEFTAIDRFNIYGTFLEGENIYYEKLSEKGFIIMGSESHGISEKWIPYIDKKLFIPYYPTTKKTSESLNISIATAIVCSEFRRRMI